MEFSERIKTALLTYLSAQGLVDQRLAESPDIDEMWDKVAPMFVKDAVREVAEYPTVALGWAMYLGMAVAHFWDEDWATYSAKDNLYIYLRDKRGFDYMDEVVRGEILGLDQDAFAQMEKTVQNCAANVWSTIRHEQVEPQSPAAFKVFVAAVKVLYTIGAAMELKRLGYSMQLASGNQPN